MQDSNLPSGKIAFIFPAKFSLEGAKSPTLNFIVRDDGIIAMSMGMSFLELKNDTNYMVYMSLFDPSGKEIPISTPLATIPGDTIDPFKQSSFLTASYHFKPSYDGVHSFNCELRDIVKNPGGNIASMKVFFNVLGVGVSHGS